MEMTTNMLASLPTLVRMQIDPMIATNLIRFCLNPRASYLCRVQDRDQSLQALLDFDERVDPS